MTNESYLGTFRNNRFHGEGVYQWLFNQERYVGHFLRGEKWGEGVLYKSNGEIIEGQWAKNRLAGKCHLQKANGIIYILNIRRDSLLMELSVHYENDSKYSYIGSENKFEKIYGDD